MQTLFRLCLTRVTPHFALLDFSYNKGAPLTYTKNLPTDVNEYAIDWGAPWPGHISLCDFVCVSDSLQDSAPQQYVRAATTARGRCDCQRNNHTWWDAIVVGTLLLQCRLDVGIRPSDDLKSLHRLLMILDNKVATDLNQLAIVNSRSSKWKLRDVIGCSVIHVKVDSHWFGIPLLPFRSVRG